MCLQKKRLFSEIFVEKLGIVCNIMAAIRIWRRNFKKWIWKGKFFLMDIQTYQKRKEWPQLEISRDNDQKRKYFLKRKYHVTLVRTKAVTYISQITVQLSFLQINSLLSATSILSRSPMAYKTTASLDKLACTEYKVFGKSQDRCGRISWSKNDSNYLDIKLKMFKREDKNAKFWLRQNLSNG